MRKRLTIHPAYAGAVGRTEKKDQSNDLTQPCRSPYRDLSRRKAGRGNRPAHEHRLVDVGGNLISHVRMDGAWIGSIDISINKAYTSRAFDITTKDLGDNAQPGNQFYGIHASNQGKIMIFAGGIPLTRDGNVIGAIGVSGGSGEQDQTVAEAGANALTASDAHS
ncbi:heme-binding protein [Arthrobacter sp. ISL-28]|nr:heme-binding protein [Arthrobacter sp. ISL-28]